MGNLDLFEEDPALPEDSREGRASDTDSGADEGDGSPSEPVVWSVTQVNQAVKALLEEALPPLWVSGEVANWTRARSGHCYFTLKDEAAQLRCVMWRAEAARLPADPDQGMQLRAFGRLSLYEARGEFQFVVQILETEGGEGLWRLAFERLKKKLDEEGLTAPERKRPLPPFPQRIGVVTSLTGAALHDILTVLRRRAPWLRVLVRGTRVQGEGAAQEIANAVRILGGRGQVDVLIVGRGGGSIEDLWAFNEEVVARAVAECPVPVISAVGHEVDVTISDLVADHRAPTPSAGAEAVAPDSNEIRRALGQGASRMARALRREVEGRRNALKGGRRALERVGPGLTEGRRGNLMALFESASRGIRGLVTSRRARLASGAGRMDALSPLSVLRRGYAVPLGEEGRVLRRVSDFSPGGEFQLRVVDGRVVCEAVSTESAGAEIGEVKGD
jgi:exodeoxyribonuclease VII large subunit